MASSRLFYSNLLTQATFSAFSVANNAVANADAENTDPYDYSAGTAAVAGRFNPTTGYTANFDKAYVVEVHICPDGTFANTRWRWSDQGGDPSWNASTLTPVSGVWVPLSSGVEVQFTASGVAPEFVLADFWHARALRPYGIIKALDGSRNSEYRSGALPSSSTLRIGWDFGTAQAPQFIVLDDHNFPNTATVSLMSDAGTLFDAAPDTTQVIPWRANRMAALVTSAARRYWWLTIVMGAAGLSYGRISELFLGTGATLAKQPTAGLTEHESFLASIDMANIASRGVTPRVYTAARRQRTWRRVRRDVASDGGKLDAAFTYARDHASYTMPPLWYLNLDTDLTNVELNSWAGDLQRTHHVADLWDYQTDWVQVIRTVAS